MLDAQPMAMARELDGVERPPAEALPEWTADGELAEVGPLNDRAYGFGTDSFTRALQQAAGGREPTCTSPATRASQWAAS